MRLWWMRGIVASGAGNELELAWSNMAGNESDREDLLREATALVERVELSVPGFAEPIVAGFRRDGSISFFLGAERVYQFNAAGELRRAFVDDLLYKAEAGRLVSLRRERSQGVTALLRRELDDAELTDFLSSMQRELRKLLEALNVGQTTIVGQVPAEGEVTLRIAAWLSALPAEVAVANRPNAGGKLG